MSPLPATAQDLRDQVAAMIQGQLKAMHAQGALAGLQMAVAMIQAVLDTGEPNDDQIAVLCPLRDTLLDAQTLVRAGNTEGLPEIEP